MPPAAAQELDGGFLLPATRPVLHHLPPPPIPRPAGVPVPVDGVPGRGLPGGWSFDDAPAPAVAPLSAAYLVVVRIGAAGFLVAGRPVTARRLAGWIAAAGPPPGRPVLLHAVGDVRPGPAVELLLGALSDALDRPVVVAESGLWVSPAGAAVAAGGFRAVFPRRPGADGTRAGRRVRRLGPTLPGRPPDDHPFAGTREAPRTTFPGVTTSPGVTAGPAPVAVAWAGAEAVPDAPAPPVPSAGPAAIAPPRPAGPAKAFEAARPAPAEPEVAATAPGPVAPLAPVPLEAGLRELLVPGRRPALPPVLAEPAGAPAELAVAPPPEAARPAPAPAPTAAVAAEPEEPAGVPEEAPGALWLAAPSADPDPGRALAERAAVRQALNGRYDAHARIVARRLSEDPGLRAVAGGGSDITAGLVAVRAYLTDEREFLNGVLRGSGGGADRERAEALGRAAAYGLRRLPSVFGPVFRAGGAEAAAGFVPGEELVEPAFLDVDLVPGPEAPDGVEFAIWSVTAHRVAGLDAGDGAALFPPGTRFSVLAVDRPADGSAPVRVLLRDLAAARRGRAGTPENAERILSRLREIPRRGRARPGDRRMSFLPGLDDRGRRFRRAPAAVSEPEGGAR